jgi:hypothetical protein
LETPVQQALRQVDGDPGAKVTTTFEERVMKVSPFAGKPAEPVMLVNVPRLVTSFRGAERLRDILEEAQTIVNDAIAPVAPSITDFKEKGGTELIS